MAQSYPKQTHKLEANTTAKAYKPKLINLNPYTNI